MHAASSASADRKAAVIVAEATQDLSRPGAKAIATTLTNDKFIRTRVDFDEDDHILYQLLDRGETESLILAKQLDATILLDEKRARQIAAARGIPVTGTAAILVKAKQQRWIHSVKPLLEKLTTMGYRLSPALIQHALVLTGE